MLLLVVALYRLGVAVKDYVKKGEWNKYGRVLRWVIFIVAVGSILTFGYGRGRVDLQSEVGETVGHMKMLEAVPPPNVDSVAAAAEEKRPEVLKRQDDAGFAEEKAEADAYLKEIGVE